MQKMTMIPQCKNAIELRRKLGLLFFNCDGSLKIKK